MIATLLRFTICALFRHDWRRPLFAASGQFCARCLMPRTPKGCPP